MAWKAIWPFGPNLVEGALHAIEVDWQSGASGRVDWWLDGAPQLSVTGFDNSARKIDQVRLGTVAGLHSGTSGTVYFDAFGSRRQTYIGAGTDLPEYIFADDFESGGFGYWNANTGVSVTTAASLAPAGSQGMSVPLAGATTAKYTTDSAPAVESRYRARFYFDPNSITMAKKTPTTLSTMETAGQPPFCRSISATPPLAAIGSGRGCVTTPAMSPTPSSSNGSRAARDPWGGGLMRHRSRALPRSPIAAAVAIASAWALSPPSTRRPTAPCTSMLSSPADSPTSVR